MWVLKTGRLLKKNPGTRRLIQQDLLGGARKQAVLDKGFQQPTKGSGLAGPVGGDFEVRLFRGLRRG